MAGHPCRVGVCLGAMWCQSWAAVCHCAWEVGWVPSWEDGGWEPCCRLRRPVGDRKGQCKHGMHVRAPETLGPCSQPLQGQYRAHPAPVSRFRTVPTFTECGLLLALPRR